jgi:ketosteroid isomerase-like protein
LVKRAVVVIPSLLLGVLLGRLDSLSAPAGQEVLQADAQFAAATAARGLEGFLSYLADKDLLKFQGPGPPLTTREAVRQAMSKTFAAPGFELRWKPLRGDASGGLGYTYGAWETRANNRPARSGHYVTIWKKQPDGRWRVVVDIGN